MEITEAKKIFVLHFVCFKRCQTGDLRKNLLEYFTAAFGILNDIIVLKIENSGKF